jgi:hypothetical protein
MHWKPAVVLIVLVMVAVLLAMYAKPAIDSGISALSGNSSGASA